MLQILLAVLQAMKIPGRSVLTSYSLFIDFLKVGKYFLGEIGASYKQLYEAKEKGNLQFTLTYIYLLVFYTHEFTCTFHNVLFRKAEFFKE